MRSEIPMINLNINPRIFHAALIFYCLLIFILSSIPGENFPKIDFEFSDKIVHVIIYSVLFALFYFSLKNQHKNVKLHKFSLEYSLLFTAIYGMTDEIHQYFVTNRSCEFYDWAADVAGGLIVFSIIKLYNSRYKKPAVLLLMIIISGCSSAGNKITDKSITTAESEVWLDLMPKAGDNSNVFMFRISLNTDADKTEGEFEIKNFKIFLNNDTLVNKKFQLNTEKTVNNIMKIEISQDNKEIYLNASKDLPADAVISFDVYESSRKIKNIKTPKLKINKAH